MLAALRTAPSSPHVGKIEFGPTKGSRGASWAGPVTIEYDGEVYSVDLDMIDVFLEDMIAFFDEIARPDWDRPNAWESEFHEITLDTDPLPDGLVKLSFQLWWSRDDERREGELVVRHADLAGFARRLRTLTGWQGEANRFAYNRWLSERLAARSRRS